MRDELRKRFEGRSPKITWIVKVSRHGAQARHLACQLGVTRRAWVRVCGGGEHSVLVSLLTRARLPTGAPPHRQNIGYELRCADPIPFDIEYTRILGSARPPLGSPARLLLRV